MVKLRFISLIVPETTAKEARIHLTLCGFEHTVHPDIAWIEDLATFSKAPPGVCNYIYTCYLSHLAIAGIRVRHP